MADFDRQAARCVFAGIAGTTPTKDELELVRSGIGGVILFARNIQEPAQVAELARELKAASPDKLMVCIDQEGGRVQRLRPPFWTDWPSARRIGQIDEQGGI